MPERTGLSRVCMAAACGIGLHIAVVGAVGFVGQHLCRRLQREGYRVCGAATRRNEFLLDGLDVPAATGPHDVVINLAYPTGPSALCRRQENRAILEQVERVARPGGLVVHVSSLAVFGVGLDRPITLGPVRWRPDIDYVENKVWMERRMARSLAGRVRLEIVRLGNVWGEGSPLWLARLAARVREGKPVLVRGGTASNVTDVANVVDYLAHLVALFRPDIPKSAPGFHHLAELGANPWSVFVAPVAETMGLRPVEVDPPGDDPWMPLLVGQAAVPAFRFLNSRPVAGSLTRRMLGALPARIVARLSREKRAPAPSSGIEDPSLLAVLGCRRVFPSHTSPGWAPPVALRESIERACGWLRRSGFASPETAAERIADVLPSGRGISES